MKTPTIPDLRQGIGQLLIVCVVLSTHTGRAAFAADDAAKEAAGKTEQSATPTPTDVGEAKSTAVTAWGQVTSKAASHVLCQVRSVPPEGIEVKTALPEGAVVTAGQQIVTLSAPALEEQLEEWWVAFLVAEAELVKARVEWDIAKLSLVEFQEGYCLEQETALMEALFSAKRCVEDLQADIAHTEASRKEGESDSRKVDEAKAILEQRRAKVSLAERKLAVWGEYTKKKFEAQLQGDVICREASHRVGQAKVKVAQQRLERIRQETDQCTLKAPVAGRIHYPNPLVPGEHVPPGVVVHIYDSAEMLFEARVHREAQVTPGMPATVRLDAAPKEELRGQVESVNGPAPEANRKTRFKRVVVRIHNPPEFLRPGQTGEVSIWAEAQ